MVTHTANARLIKSLTVRSHCLQRLPSRAHTPFHSHFATQLWKHTTKAISVHDENIDADGENDDLRS